MILQEDILVPLQPEDREQFILDNQLHDSEDKVRMEAPEMFRVMGKKRPGTVRPYLESLQSLAENDSNPVVRIHSAGAIRITKKELNGD